MTGGLRRGAGPASGAARFHALWLVILVFCLGAVTSPFVAVASGAETGSLTQLSGAAGCIEQDPLAVDDTCGSDKSLDSGDELASARAVAAYGGYVYVGGDGDGGGAGIVVLKATAGSGLTAQSCINSSGDGTCTQVVPLYGYEGITGITIGPGGAHVYVDLDNQEIIILSRNATTGALTWGDSPLGSGCVSQDGSELGVSDTAGACTTAPAAPGGTVVFSPDGANAYSTA